MRLRVALLGFLLSLSLFAGAQQVRDAVTVEVVDVPVYVSRGDEPVLGLTRDDFELYVNGKLQPIEYFDVVTPSSERTLHDRRLFLLVFDMAFSRPYALLRAQKAAIKLIESSPQSDLFAIATYSSRDGVQFAAPFSADRVALQRAIGKLRTSESGDPLAIVMTSSERATMESFRAVNAEWTDTFLASTRTSDRLTSDFALEMLRAQNRWRTRDQMESLADLSERLASLEGQKHVVILSEGYTQYDTAEFVSRTAPAAPWRQTTMFSTDSYFLANLQDMARAFQKSDVLMHALDLEGLNLGPGFDEGLHLLSTSTNGKFVNNRNDLAAALSDISAGVANGYRLGFRPQGVRDGHNTIKVKVKNQRFAEVNHRLGFVGTPLETNVDDGLYLADVVLNDVPQTGTAASLELNDGTLTASVPLQLLAAQLGKKGQAELLVYVFDKNGRALAFHKQKIEVPANAVGESTIVIPMPEDAAVAKALLRVDESLGFTKVGRSS